MEKLTISKEMVGNSSIIMWWIILPSSLNLPSEWVPFIIQMQTLKKKGVQKTLHTWQRWSLLQHLLCLSSSDGCRRGLRLDTVCTADMGTGPLQSCGCKMVERVLKEAEEQVQPHCTDEEADSKTAKRLQDHAGSDRDAQLLVQCVSHFWRQTSGCCGPLSSACYYHGKLASPRCFSQAPGAWSQQEAQNSKRGDGWCGIRFRASWWHQ